MGNRVLFREEDDAIFAKWGEDGTEHAGAADEDGLRKVWREALAEGIGTGDAVEDEVDRSVAREMQEGVGIRKDASGGLIVAYWPSPEVAGKLDAILPAGLPGRLAPEDLHLTLIYLDDESWTEAGRWDLQLLLAVTKIWSRETYGENTGVVGGLGRFVGPEDSDVFVALVDAHCLTWMRDDLLDRLYCHGAIPVGSAAWNGPQHGFIPHVTLAYVGKGQETLPALTGDTIEITFDNVVVASGPDRVKFDLGYASQAMATEDSSPFYAARAAVKAGRVLSAKNLKALRDSIASMQAVVEAEEKRRKKDDEEYATKRAEILGAVAGPEDETEGLEYAVTKADEEWRYTMGPLYAPERKDAHGEYTDADTLQRAVHDYVRLSAAEGRRINLQHGDLGEVTVGEWVEVVSWPYDHTIKVATAEGEERELDMPAGTVYVGAVWDEDAWPLVKSGKLNGWSLGGKAVRVAGGEADMLSMGDAVKADPDKPYGDVAYADPGYQEDGKKRYPLDTKAHVKAAWSYINQGDNADFYTADQLRKIKAKIKAAAKKFGVEISEEKEASWDSGASIIGLAARGLELEREALRAEREADRSWMERVFDRLGQVAEKSVTIPPFPEPGDIHVHLPEQNVTIKQNDGLDQLLEPDPEE